MATHYEHAHYMTKWRIGHAQSLTCCTNPQIRNCQDDEKLACHGPARYKMEWIYTQAKVSGQGSLALALVMKKKKERKKERKKDWQLAIFQTSGSDIYNCFDERSWSLWYRICWRFWFSHLEIPQNYLFWDIWVFVMYYIYGSVRAIPTYRVYRLYDRQ